jgi:lysophospholipase L1-like esterase
VLVTGYWNVFLDGAVARTRGEKYLRLTDAATRAVNALIASEAKAHGATFVDLFTPFRGSDGSRDCTALLAADGDHPDAEGHALIARTLAAAL